MKPPGTITRHRRARSQKDAEPDRDGLTVRALSSLAGLHEVVERTYLELSVPPLSLPVARLRKDETFLQLLARQQIQVTRVNKRLRCVGNIRVYMAMTDMLPPETEVRCYLMPRVSDEQIRRNCVAEFVYLPALLGIHSADVPIAYEVALRAMQAGLWTPPSALEGYFAKLFGVDPRRFRGKGRQPAVDSEVGPLAEPPGDAPTASGPPPDNNAGLDQTTSTEQAGEEPPATGAISALPTTGTPS